MLMLISPAKKLDFESETSLSVHSQPQFIESANTLAVSARKLSRTQLAQSMKISDNLADLNYKRFQSFKPPFDLGNAKQAALVFNGDTYVGLQAQIFDEKDFSFAQDHLRILSGLYGILRPLDLIQPYRLEMGARFSPPNKKDLYDFWAEQLTDAINNELSTHKDQSIINLASNEYFKAIKTKQLNGRLVTPVFKDRKNGNYKIISFFAKKARGMMARYIIENQLKDVEGIKHFDKSGYYYSAEQSTKDQWVFLREEV